MRVAIGIDVGGTKLGACALDERDCVLTSALSDVEHERDALISAMADLCSEVLRGIDHDTELVGIGLGLPGLVDRSAVLHETPNLRAAEETVLSSDFAPRLRAACTAWAGRSLETIRFVAENDATCAAAGELALGAAREMREAIVITLGTGIGGGVIAGGRIQLGHQGFAGEVGHIVVAADGPACVCGGSGCWEQFSSGSGIARLAREALALPSDPPTSLSRVARGELRAEDVVAAARAGDAAASAVMETAARYLAIGMSNLAEILDPEAIVVGGGMSVVDDALVGPARRYFSQYRRGAGPRAVPIVPAALGPGAGAIGAAALALGRV